MLGAGRVISRLVGHVQSPLYGRAYALILSSASTSGLGLLYWTLAARLYSANDVGVNAAVISTMVFLSYLAQLSLPAWLPRLLPTAGRAATRIILAAYCASVPLSALVAIVFVVGAGVWAPALRSLLDPPAGAWFVVSTAVWSVFALQDAVLTGLRRTVWVPIENTIFAVVKIGVLVALAGSLTGAGIYVSWTVPAALVVVPINAIIFLRFLPRYMARHGNAAPESSFSQISRYLASDFAGSLLVSASTGLLPLIILATAGASASAYYYVAWTIASSLQLFSINMATSLIVEGAQRRSEVGPSLRRMLWLLVRLQLPLVAVLGILAPLILELFGRAYSQEGATLLRLLALGVLPHGLNALWLGLARIRHQLHVLVAVQAAQAGLLVLLTVVLLPAIGINGVGVAFLASQSAVALVAYAVAIRPLLDALRHDTPIEPATVPPVEDDRTGIGSEEAPHQFR